MPGTDSSSVVLTGKVVVTGTGNGTPGAFPMRGIDASTGRTLWEMSGNQQYPELSTDGRRVYAWSTINSTTTELVAIDPSSGKERWRIQDLQTTDGGAGGNSPVTVDRDMLFATDSWGEVVALQAHP